MFRTVHNLWHRLRKGSGVTGVYPTFAAAMAAAAKRGKTGYDHQESSNMYPYLLEYSKITDYVALFYMNRLIAPGGRVFDFGGNTGLLYYNYQRRWTLPAKATWTVCDVPAVVQAGREFAKTRPSEGLLFTSRFEDAAGADLLFTSGTLQYVPETLAELLQRLGDAKPRHILINRTALWDGPEFATCQNIGPTTCAYRVQNRAAFLASLEREGYQLRDAWECPESGINVRWSLRHRVRPFHGMLLERS